MPIYQIPVIWECWGRITVEANSVEEAFRKVDEDEEDFPLPEGEYIDGSWKADWEGIYAIEKDGHFKEHIGGKEI